MAVFKLCGPVSQTREEHGDLQDTTGNGNDVLNRVPTQGGKYHSNHLRNTKRLYKEMHDHGGKEYQGRLFFLEGIRIAKERNLWYWGERENGNEK